jgi:CRP-like cAMP-binding protein
MRNVDFFAFCTSLKPIELKTVGQLSWVRHMAEGDVLYSPGEPGNALYIVNRGALEVVPRKGRENQKKTYLSRGDLIGDVEVFADIRRTQLVRAMEATSLQCFPRANFPELLRLVPSFFRYVCEQMATRTVKERDLAHEQNEDLQLSGRISNFDLTTIHQTIMSSGQTGELSIKDDKSEPLGVFYFELGRPCAGQFQHLTGEEAFWQLFLCDNLSGTFSFSVSERPMTDWIQSGSIPQSGGDLLIAALQFRDELDALKKGMVQNSEKLRARATELQWTGGAPLELKSLATQIWESLLRGPKTIDELYRQCSVCELRIYQVVAELLYSGQVSSAAASDQGRGETAGAPTPDAVPNDVALIEG